MSKVLDLIEKVHSETEWECEFGIGLLGQSIIKCSNKITPDTTTYGSEEKFQEWVERITDYE